MVKASRHASSDPEISSVDVAVVIPAFNVARHIKQVLDGIPTFVRHIIVVDDASTDDTAKVIEDTRTDRVVLVRHRENRGVGGAVLTGYAVALRLEADIVVKVDGDDQMDPRQMRRLIDPIIRKEADYTKGNRFIHLQALEQMPPQRRMGNYGLTFLTKVASGYWGTFDPTNGYTGIHSALLRMIDTSSVAEDAFFETSMLVELRRLGAVVRDVAMPARYRDEQSTVSSTRSLFSFPPRLCCAFFRRLLWQYFRYDFNAASLLLLLGVPLLVFGVVWGAVHWYLSVTTGELATTGTVLLAVLPIILGMQFLVQGAMLDIGSVPSRAVSPELLQAPDQQLAHSRDEHSLERYLSTHPCQLPPGISTG